MRLFRSRLSDKIIVAPRDDGVGSRLTAIVRCMMVAERLGCRFGFTWNSEPYTPSGFHTVDGVRQVFSQSFIEKAWLGEALDPAVFPPMRPGGRSRRALRRSAADPSVLGWQATEFGMLRGFLDKPSLLDRLRGRRRLDTAETFRQIGFSAEATNAIETASARRTERPLAAIHLRGGDVVYGRHRKFKYVHKSIPAALVPSMVSRLAERGFDALVVGQDKRVIEDLKRRTGVLTAEDFGADAFARGTMRDLFDMALLARCALIYAGRSQFVETAGTMRGRRPDSVFDLIPWTEASEMVLSELDRDADAYPAMEAAHGYQWALRGLETALDAGRRRHILEAAMRLDPDNEGYALKLAIADFGEGRLADGEALLAKVMARERARSDAVPTPSMRRLAAVYRTGPFLTGDERRHLEVAARAGCVHAAECSAFLALARKDRVKADEFAALAKSGGSTVIDRLMSLSEGQSGTRRKAPRASAGQRRA